ncbi:hypothetical protein CCHR01_15389 [Colletotrichum chrysophilum]|uniref:Nucleoside phosphorylase domain-containing protein n=1 Tax=Colletotrichum chrysophilum TaxID=1836956 RepID=A0AAD9A5R9_9PEZI|nr:hypothetical protein CCHR01_15389 [Colletotrichum chrysophilum]
MGITTSRVVSANEGVTSEAEDKNAYTVGWICALPLEMAAAELMLDEIYETIQFDQDKNDHNSYTLGRMKSHKVVIACLPSGDIGTTPAATVANDMLRTFKSIRFALLVGIGGGAPFSGQDIRLGDIVVSKPTGTSGGVIQYDRGKKRPNGEFERTGTLLELLREAVGKIQDETIRKKYSHQGEPNDLLFEAKYEHVETGSHCDGCDISQTVQRKNRKDTTPVVHYGNIASGNQIMRDSATRDQLSKELGVLCFETEAAGLMQNFPCLVIRGICDYSDSHKNKIWQHYAAATAAAYAKDLLSIVVPTHVQKEKIVELVLRGLIYQLVVDALDECVTDRGKLLGFIQASSKGFAKWIVSSRNFPDIREALEMKTAETERLISLEQQQDRISSIVQKYIKKNVEDLAIKKDYDDSTRSKVESHLHKNANNTFLWVALVCKTLGNIQNYEVEMILDDLPESLTALYKRMLHDVSTTRNGTLRRKVLAILSVLERPIAVGELQFITELPSHISANMNFVEQLLKDCGSFLILHDGIVRFVHQSAVDFLQDEDFMQNEQFDGLSRVADRHRSVFQYAFSVLYKCETLKRNIYGLEAPGSQVEDIRPPESDPLAFLEYSCVHWPGLSEDAKALADFIGDANRFVLYNREVMEKYPLQLYASSLVFSPQDSIVKKYFRHDIPDWIVRLLGLDSAWNPCLQTLPNGYRVEELSFSSDGKWLASSSTIDHEDVVKVWAADTGILMHTLEGNFPYLLSFSFSGDSKKPSQLAIAPKSNCVEIWDPESGTHLRTLDDRSNQRN